MQRTSMTIEPMTVHEFYDKIKNLLTLAVLVEDGWDERQITVGAVNRPGLALSGFYGRFQSNRVQVVGETEAAFLASMSSEVLTKRFTELAQHPIPCIIFAKDIEPGTELIRIAEKARLPIFRSSKKTGEIVSCLPDWLDRFFCPREAKHATLVDIYGIGILLMGHSASGKSETALELVQRGHRLVADDIVLIHRRRSGILVGMANPTVGHFMEVRGIGFVDIERLFGIRGIRAEKSIEIAVELIKMDHLANPDRVGAEPKYLILLGLSVLHLQIPVAAGKSITSLCEVIAMNYMLQLRGYHSAEEFRRKQFQLIQSQCDPGSE